MAKLILVGFLFKNTIKSCDLLCHQRQIGLTGIVYKLNKQLKVFIVLKSFPGNSMHLKNSDRLIEVRRCLWASVW